MKNLWLRIAFCALATGAVFGLGSTAEAAMVMWNLNPQDLNQSLGTASQTFTSHTFSITAYGFDNVRGADTPHDLFYKNTDLDHGLGLDGTLHNELQVKPNGAPAQYIQFDLSSILPLGATNGQIKISSVDPGEAFNLYASNRLGVLGRKISLGGGPYGDENNNIFVNIPDFGSFKFISVVAAIGDVLPWVVCVNIPAIPETGGASAVFVLLAFFGVVLASRAIRARYRG